MTVLAVDKYESNADLIMACVELGYLRADRSTLDPTYGLGIFWQKWQPDELFMSDINPDLTTSGVSIDFTKLPHDNQSFDVVVFDPPYKLNGTPDVDLDERYGVHVPTRWQERMALCRDGVAECARVARDLLLVKCKDQVCSGKVRWQTTEFTREAEACGFGLYDRLDYLSYRPQPANRSQQHARRNTSTLLVLKRGWSSSDLAERNLS